MPTARIPWWLRVIIATKVLWMVAGFVVITGGIMWWGVEAEVEGDWLVGVGLTFGFSWIMSLAVLGDETWKRSVLVGGACVLIGLILTSLFAAGFGRMLMHICLAASVVGGIVEWIWQAFSCPNCRRVGGVMKLGTEEMGSSTEYKTVARQDEVWDASGNPRHLGSIQRQEQVAVQRQHYRVYRKCRHCNHEWYVDRKR